MGDSRRSFVRTALTAVWAAAMPRFARAQGIGHAHQAIPSDLTLRVKSLESLLVEKGLVDR
jgi:hypothetical protein